MIRVLFTLFSHFGAARRGQLVRVALLTLALIAFSSGGFLYFEHEAKPELTWSDALWWSLVTMTTVGYGDYFPTSVGGRYLVALPTMMLGISVLGYLLSTVASFLIERRSKELKGMAEILLKGHILVVHYPSEQRVLALLDELQADSATAASSVVLIDDTLAELPSSLQERGVRFVAGNPTKESTLRRAGLEGAKHAIVLAKDPNDPRSDDSTLAVTLSIEHLCPGVRSVAECVDPEHVRLLRRTGCDSVVCLAEMTASLLVSEVHDPGVQQVLLDLASSNDDGQQIYLEKVERLDEWRFSALQQQLEREGCLALGVRRDGVLLLNPGPTSEIVRGDVVICMGSARPRSISGEKAAARATVDA